MDRPVSAAARLAGLQRPFSAEILGRKMPVWLYRAMVEGLTDVAWAGTRGWRQ